MDIAIRTFQHSTKLNDFDWDRAYAVLNYHLQKGSIQKGILPGDQVIFHNLVGVEGHQLTHVRYLRSSLKTM